ncbi:MAG: hypothetical protein QM808_14500 [Steroidobacteraceae bacterium]
MNNSHKSRLLTALLVCLIAACGGKQDGANSSPAPKGARFTPNLTWEEMFKLPKLWGVSWSSTREWDNEIVYINRMTLIPPLKPEYLAASEAFVKRAIEGKAEFKAGACYPNGVPRSIWYSYAPGFLFRPGNSLLITSFGETREVWMDGRAHPKTFDPNDTAIAYLGHSVGWWEGDTLVIDTVGFAPDHEVYYDVPNGGSMHVVERYRLADAQTLETTLTVEDPDKLTQPWVLKRNYLSGKAPGITQTAAGAFRIETQRCRPGFGREVLDEAGNARVDLTPPPKGLGIGQGPDVGGK